MELPDVFKNQDDEYLQNAPGGHIHYFNRFTVLETLKYCGLEIVDHLYTSAVVELHQKNLSLFNRFLNLCRSVCFKISPNFAANRVGGYSLMAITK